VVGKSEVSILSMSSLLLLVEMLWVYKKVGEEVLEKLEASYPQPM